MTRTEKSMGHIVLGRSVCLSGILTLLVTSISAQMDSLTQNNMA